VYGFWFAKDTKIFNCGFFVCLWSVVRGFRSVMWGQVSKGSVHNWIYKLSGFREWNYQGDKVLEWEDKRG
jgi:hypothetical protein